MWGAYLTSSHFISLRFAPDACSAGAASALGGCGELVSLHLTSSHCDLHQMPAAQVPPALWDCVGSSSHFVSPHLTSNCTSFLQRRCRLALCDGAGSSSHFVSPHLTTSCHFILPRLTSSHFMSFASGHCRPAGPLVVVTLISILHTISLSWFCRRALLGWRPGAGCSSSKASQPPCWASTGGELCASATRPIPSCLLYRCGGAWAPAAQQSTRTPSVWDACITRLPLLPPHLILLLSPARAVTSPVPECCHVSCSRVPHLQLLPPYRPAGSSCLTPLPPRPCCPRRSERR